MEASCPLISYTHWYRHKQILFQYPFVKKPEVFSEYCCSGGAFYSCISSSIINTTMPLYRIYRLTSPRHNDLVDFQTMWKRSHSRTEIWFVLDVPMHFSIQCKLTSIAQVKRSTWLCCQRPFASVSANPRCFYKSNEKPVRAAALSMYINGKLE